MALKILVYHLINDEWYLRQVVNTTTFMPISCLKMRKMFVIYCAFIKTRA